MRASMSRPPKTTKTTEAARTLAKKRLAAALQANLKRRKVAGAKK